MAILRGSLRSHLRMTQRVNGSRRWYKFIAHDSKRQFESVNHGMAAWPLGLNVPCHGAFGRYPSESGRVMLTRILCRPSPEAAFQRAIPTLERRHSVIRPLAFKTLE